LPPPRSIPLLCGHTELQDESIGSSSDQQSQFPDQSTHQSTVAVKSPEEEAQDEDDESPVFSDDNVRAASLPVPQQNNQPSRVLASLDIDPSVSQLTSVTSPPVVLTSKSFKCVVVGDPDVDKTALLQSYVDSNVLGVKDYVPMVFATCKKLIWVGGRCYNMLLKDTAGQEDYDRLHAVNYHQADVFLVCFSVVKPSTLDSVRNKWIPDIQFSCARTPFVLVGTQMDRRDDPETVEHLRTKCLKPTTLKDGKALAKELKAFKYLECSTVTRYGVDDVFAVAMKACIKSKPKIMSTLSRIGLKRLIWPTVSSQSRASSSEEETV
jgi:cell division control protein 42